MTLSFLSDLDQLRLIYNGKDLEGDEKLEDYGIQQLSVIQGIMKMRGGKGIISFFFTRFDSHNINLISLSVKRLSLF